MSRYALSAEEVELTTSTRGLRALAQQLVSSEIAPDAAVGWAARVNGRWELEGGWASAGDRLEQAPIFDLASLTKPMMAMALAWSDVDRARAIGDMLEEVRVTTSAEVSLELLLAHRAGLEAHIALYGPLVAGGEIDRTAALRSVGESRRVDATGLLPEEGFAPVYSDLGYALVGEAVARELGARDAGEVIEHLVAGALGRDDLGTARRLSAQKDLRFAERVRPTEVVAWRGGTVRGVVHDENAWALTKDGGSGHAGIFGTLEAVLSFGCASLDAIERGKGPLLAARERSSGEDLAWLVRPRPSGSLRAGFDGKSERGSSAGELAGPRTFGHLGFTGTSVWIDPDANVVVAILTNRVHPSRDNVSIRAARPIVHDALFRAARRRIERAARSDALRG